MVERGQKVRAKGSDPQEAFTIQSRKTGMNQQGSCDMVSWGFRKLQSHTAMHHGRRSPTQKNCEGTCTCTCTPTHTHTHTHTHTGRTEGEDAEARENTRGNKAGSRQQKVTQAVTGL